MPPKKSQRTPKVKFTNRGKRLTQSQLWQVQDILTATELPKDFERFLLTYNGGNPDPAYFDWKHSKDGITRSEVDSLQGIDLGPLAERSADCLRLAMWYRADLPRHAFPFGIVDRDNLLLLYTAGKREGQVWLLIQSELDHRPGKWPDPETATYFVAKSFTDFLNSLYELPDKYEPFTFALDSRRVRGKQLEAILKSLGCKRWKYKGVWSATPLPPRWVWPKYRGSEEDDRPAGLSLEKNNTYGYAPHFDERPKGHKMLYVDVTESQRAACIRELSAALGEGAVLLEAT
jgi:SMI1 / KNR4 family (SUKH-1)